jgi:hypothetical protein
MKPSPIVRLLIVSAMLLAAWRSDADQADAPRLVVRDAAGTLYQVRVIESWLGVAIGKAKLLFLWAWTA